MKSPVVKKNCIVHMVEPEKMFQSPGRPVLRRLNFMDPDGYESNHLLAFLRGEETFDK